MPLFAKEPLRLDDSRSLTFEDCDESEWMYVSTSRQISSWTDKIQRKLRVFDSMTKYERRHVRLSVRHGTDITLQLYRSDSMHDTDCVGYYDLSTLQNVKNVTLEREKSLPFLRFTDDGVGSMAVTEMIFGQIGLRLEMNESVSDGVRTGVHGATAGGGTLAESGIDDDQTTGGASSTLPQLLQDATAAAGLGSVMEDGAALAMKQNKKLQKKLERKGRAVAIQLVLSSVDNRDEWGYWFRSLMKHLELHRIIEVEVDSATGEAQAPVDPEVVQRIADSRAMTFASAAFRASVREYTNRFLNLDRKDMDEASLVPPAKGRLQARVPGAESFGHYEVSAWVQSGEVMFTPYQPKGGAAASFSGGGGGGATLLQQVARRLRLTESTLIFAPVPWSCEFQILIRNDNAMTTTTTAAWYLIAPTPDDRNRFVRWMRLVKGRGTLSQTERETFPFAEEDEEDGGGADADGGRVSVYGNGLMEQVYARSGVNEAAAAAAAFMQRQQRGQIAASSSIDKAEGADDESKESIDEEEEGEMQKTVGEQVVLPPSRKVISAAEQLQRLYDELRPPIVSPRSDDSVHSVRSFHYFPTHIKSTLTPWLNDTCAIHLFGRRERASDHFSGGGHGRVVASNNSKGGGRKRGDYGSSSSLSPRQRWSLDDALSEESNAMAGVEDADDNGDDRPRKRRTSILVHQLVEAPHQRRVRSSSFLSSTDADTSKNEDERDTPATTPSRQSELSASPNPRSQPPPSPTTRRRSGSSNTKGVHPGIAVGRRDSDKQPQRFSPLPPNRVVSTSVKGGTKASSLACLKPGSFSDPLLTASSVYALRNDTRMVSSVAGGGKRYAVK